MSARVACECCDGTGKRPLHVGERRVLDAVPARWTATAEIERTIRPQPKRPALCNQLVRLVDLGLVERRESATDARASQWRRSP